MKTVAELMSKFKANDILLFNADNHNETDISFNGTDKLDKFIEFIKLNNIKYAFYSYVEVSKESLIDLNLITEEEYDFEYKRIKKEAKEYNKMVEMNIGNLIFVEVFI
ncbi:hypothetical protein KDN24_06530 [Bacillus sp. Bva_UNVM-123]|uniref:hypothetical protein n=1 Tax=Bacillus sp. Bva_UNVM-123 TaxID=2829798 RepID=UPI00391F71BC